MADSGVGRPDHADIRDARELIAQARRELWWFIETYTDEDEDAVARAMSIQDYLLYPALQGVVALLGEVERRPTYEELLDAERRCLAAEEEVARLTQALERIASDDCMIVQREDGPVIDTTMPERIAREVLAAVQP